MWPYMVSRDCPCKGCSDRTPECHATCQRYGAWSAWRRGKLDEKRLKRDQLEYDIKRSIKLARIYRGIKK